MSGTRVLPDIRIAERRGQLTAHLLGLPAAALHKDGSNVSLALELLRSTGPRKPKCVWFAAHGRAQKGGGRPGDTGRATNCPINRHGLTEFVVCVEGGRAREASLSNHGSKLVHARV